MGLVSIDQVRAYQPASIYPSLGDYMRRKRVRAAAYGINPVSAPNAQFVLLDSGYFNDSSFSTGEEAGVVVAKLAGAIGAADSSAIFTNSAGQHLNMVELIDAATSDPILDDNGGRVYGLLQVAQTAADGEAIEPIASENVQMSFVTYLGGVFTLVDMPRAFRFQYNVRSKAYAQPQDLLEGEAQYTDELAPEPETQTLKALYTVTSWGENSATGTTLTLSNGAIAGGGASTPSGDNTQTNFFPADAATFESNNKVHVWINGARAVKGVHVAYVPNANPNLVALDFAGLGYKPQPGETICFEFPNGY